LLFAVLCITLPIDPGTEVELHWMAIFAVLLSMQDPFTLKQADRGQRPLQFLASPKDSFYAGSLYLEAGRQRPLEFWQVPKIHLGVWKKKKK